MSPSTFVLVHGAWHDSNCWYKLKPLLESMGHQVLAPDLPGHGSDNTPLGKLSLKYYAKVIAGLIDSLNIPLPLVLVGHSMAGMVITQVLDMLPNKISQLIFISAFLPQNRQSVFDLMAQTAIQDGPSKIEKYLTLSEDKRICTIDKLKIAELFYNQCSQKEQQRALALINIQATLPLSGKVKFDQAHFSKVNTSYISCLQDNVIPVSHQMHMLKKQVCDQVYSLDCDHSPFYSSPNKLGLLLNQIANLD